MTSFLWHTTVFDLRKIMYTAIHHPGYKWRNKPQSEQTATPEKYPQKYFNDKKCRQCCAVFSPKAPSHLYCSQGCADLALTNKRLKKEYGIDYTTVTTMFQEQGGKCVICGGDGFALNKRQELKLVVDHDHNTGSVRGLLCHNCNRALGLFHDDKEVLKNALKYLDK